MAWVYILRGARRYYIGATDNLERRIAEHKRGSNHTTLRFGDHVELVAAKELPSIRKCAPTSFELRTAIGISPSTLPQYNRSSRDHYSKYYDNELREFVRARFAGEIERFGYTFEEQ